MICYYLGVPLFSSKVNKQYMDIKNKLAIMVGQKWTDFSISWRLDYTSNYLHIFRNKFIQITIPIPYVS